MSVSNRDPDSGLSSVTLQKGLGDDVVVTLSSWPGSLAW